MAMAASWSWGWLTTHLSSGGLGRPTAYRLGEGLKKEHSNEQSRSGDVFNDLVLGSFLLNSIC